MSASEFYDRATATTEFLEHGLGANLSDVASGVATTAFQSDEADERERRSSALYAAGTIMERAAWLAIGNWIGYFESARVASDGEREFSRSMPTPYRGVSAGCFARCSELPRESRGIFRF